MNALPKIFAHMIFRTRRFNDRSLKCFAQDIKGKKILELGSGFAKNGTFPYSAKDFFDSSNEFTRSDVNPDFGHKVIDACAMEYREEFDVILCMNVLEHVYDFHRAIANIHRALQPGGTALIFVPGFYPLHDEPKDYWRFTEHALRRMLQSFPKIELKHSGLRQYPFAYYVKASK